MSVSIRTQSAYSTHFPFIMSTIPLNFFSLITSNASQLSCAVPTGIDSFPSIKPAQAASVNSSRGMLLNCIFFMSG